MNNNKGIFNTIGNAITGAVSAVTGNNAATPVKNNSRKAANTPTVYSNVKEVNVSAIKIPVGNAPGAKNTPLVLPMVKNAPGAPKKNATARKLNFGFTNSPKSMTGGVAPVNFRYPANMQQPSEAIMEWATTAGIPTPTTGMRNVAQGGGRRRHRARTHRHHKKHRVHRRHRTMKRRRDNRRKTRRN